MKNLLKIFKNLLFSLFLIILIISSAISTAQNVAITDDAGYTAAPSAMLDVKSTTKGMLVPRVTSAQRALIVNPAQGLLLFDTDEGSFYFYDSSSWINLSYGNPSGLWNQSGSDVYLSDPAYNVGVGTNNPLGKLEVIGDVPMDSGDPLFEVLNSNGDTVFAVFSQGVQIRVADDPAVKAVASKSGFAIGGFSLTKGLTNEYLRVTPDSVRVYIEEGNGSKATANKGGFAIGGFSLTKGLTDDYLLVNDTATKIWTSGTSGFEVKDIATGESNYMDLNPDNYFIGHQSGQANNGGMYNSFVGYTAGQSNTYGSNNVFLGYESGKANEGGSNNVYLGYQAGAFTATGISGNVLIGDYAGAELQGGYNVLIGKNTGYNMSGSYNIVAGTFAGTNVSGDENSIYGYYSGTGLTTGTKNVFMGSQTGNSATTGYMNTYIGSRAGGDNTTGFKNVFLGYESGYYEWGSNRLYIENSTANKTAALIYGEFDNDVLRFNANVGINTDAVTTLGVYNGNESATLTNFTQSLTSSGINIITDYSAGTYTPGLFWSTQNEYAAKPKAGIWLFEDGSGSDMYFGTSNSYATGITNTAMVIEETGNVGIGTVNPTVNLDVYGTAMSRIKVTSSDNQAGISFLSDNTGEAVVYSPDGSDDLRFYLGLDRLSITSLGNVGIGTTNPGYKLHVVDNEVNSDNPAIYGIHSVTDNYGVGVKGVSQYMGVVGEASGGTVGARFGVYGSASGGAIAWAGYFAGNVNVTGTLSKGGGSFKIDHPLDPENKYLYHSFVESPDMMNIYNGTVVLDPEGKAVIIMPDWFESLNTDFRYQLTPIGAWAPLFIEQEISDNQFLIAGGEAGMKVSWMVTGIRNDPFAQQNRIPVEVDKPTSEKGYYLHPEAYGQSIAKSLDKHKFEAK